MRIKNINGTSDGTCRCASWLEHWEKYNPDRQAVPVFCSAADCVNNSIVGAHVQKDDDSDPNWYIIPLCMTCNAKTNQVLQVSDAISLAPADVGQTCGNK
jgi:hypothetical protein